MIASRSCAQMPAFCQGRVGGVMVEATEIVHEYGGRTGLALGTTTFITGAIGAARILGGWLVDRFAIPRVVAGAHQWSLGGAPVLSAWPARSSRARARDDRQA